MATDHGLAGELLDLLNGLGGTLLELDAEDALVEVDGVLASDDILEGRAPGLGSFGRGHFWKLLLAGDSD